MADGWRMGGNLEEPRNPVHFPRTLSQHVSSTRETGGRGHQQRGLEGSTASECWIILLNREIQCALFRSTHLSMHTSSQDYPLSAAIPGNQNRPSQIAPHGHIQGAKNA